MVRKTKPGVVWNNRASTFFRKVYEKIKEESYSNAEKVRDGIIKIIDRLPDHPEKYPPDKFNPKKSLDFLHYVLTIENE